MEISRHAKNNMRLYKVSERDILEAIEAADVEDKEGDKLVVLKKFRRKYSGYPLKVIYERTENQLFIITAYPLKKKMWR
ncbi:MAG TPA: DUF4258 domain-containing protein [Thermodesulfobacteriota bacterium]|nr:DUF4258 domain-containing protein [Thermodesulfobacteriota bacterium]